MPLITGKAVPSPDNLLSVINCLSIAASDEFHALATDAGWNMDRLSKEGRTKVSKLAQRIFAFVAGAEIGATLGTAINDVTMADAADRSMYFVPSENAQKAFDAGPWAWHTTSNRAYEFLLPSTWKVVPGPKTDFPVTGDNLAVVNDQGETVATFLTGLSMGQGQISMKEVAASMGLPTGSYQVEMDNIPVPGLKELNAGISTENLLSYQSVKWGNGWRATIGVNSFLVSDKDHEWTRGFDISGSDPLRVGGSFSRTIDGSTALPEVSADLKEVERYKAYMGTSEYQAIRTMLESLRDYVKPATPAATQAAVEAIASEPWPGKK
jgi:hypothetical protein